MTPSADSPLIPPSLAERLLRASVRDAEWRDAVSGDLREEFAGLAAVRGTAAATRWYWRQALPLAARFAIGRLVPALTPPRRRRVTVAEVEGTSAIGAGWSREFRHAWRALWQRPGLAAVIVGTLAVALAANAVIFNLADALYLRPFRFAEVDRLIVVASDTSTDKPYFDRESVAAADFRDWRRTLTTVSELAALEWWDPNFSGVERPESLHGFLVTPGYFELLRRAAAARPLVHRRRRPAQRHAHRDPVARALAAALQRRSWHPRHDAAARRRAARSGRRDAAALRRALRRRRCGRRSPTTTRRGPTASATTCSRSAGWPTGRRSRRRAPNSKRWWRARRPSSPRRTATARSPWSASRVASATMRSDRSSRSGRPRRCCCCSSPAPTSPTCCWRAAPSGSRSSRSAWRWAPAGCAWCCSCSSRACASPCSASASAPRLAGVRHRRVTRFPAGHGRAIRARLRVHPARSGDVRRRWRRSAPLATIAFSLVPALQAARGAQGGALVGGARAATAPPGRQWMRSLLAGAQVALTIALVVASALIVGAVNRAAYGVTGFDRQQSDHGAAHAARRRRTPTCNRRRQFAAGGRGSTAGAAVGDATRPR